jgi:hypothetical protein
MANTRSTKALPRRCAWFAPHFTAMVEALPTNSTERQELGAKLAVMRRSLLRLVDVLLDMWPFDELRSPQHAPLREKS